MKRGQWCAGFAGLASLSCLVLGCFSVQGAEGLPQAEQVIQRAVERANLAEEQNYYGKYTFTRLVIIEKLDARGALKDRQERLYHVFPVNGMLYPRLVQKNGQPLSGQDLKRELEQERKFREKLGKHRRHQDDFRLVFNEELVNRYRFQMVGREPVNGRLAYLLTFEPKSDDLPVRKRRDRILNKLAGKIWIDEQEYGVSKVQLNLTEGASFGFGILGSVRRFVGVIGLARMEKDFWLPQWADVSIEGRILFSPVRQKQSLRWSEFKRVDQQVAEQKTDRP